MSSLHPPLSRQSMRNSESASQSRFCKYVLVTNVGERLRPQSTAAPSIDFEYNIHDTSDRREPGYDHASGSTTFQGQKEYLS
jgi:hypothetical protein